MKIFWIKAATAIAAVWIVCGGVIAWARAAKPSAASIERLVEKEKLEGEAPEKRSKTIAKAAEQLNRLNADERRDVQIGGKLDDLKRQMTPEEKARFVEQTMPAGFKQLMDALNKMPAAERQKFVNRAIRQFREAADQLGPNAAQLNDPAVQKIVSDGLKSFYDQASPETKMDVAPFLEQLQKQLQGVH